jgi:hypothetical protein
MTRAGPMACEAIVVYFCSEFCVCTALSSTYFFIVRRLCLTGSPASDFAFLSLSLPGSVRLLMSVKKEPIAAAIQPCLRGSISW